MTEDVGLFDAEALRVEPVAVPKQTASERLRQRQAAQIRSGLHPLTLGGAIIRLHPDATRVLEDDGQKRAPLRCGTCVHRQAVGGHARDYPKCLYSGSSSSVWPRITNGQASDVRAWWPACRDWQPATGPAGEPEPEESAAAR